jgi:sodium/potassium-transporting ATPase subunit alpha
LQSNPLWGPRRNLIVPVGMVGTAVIAIVNQYGPGLQNVFSTTPIPAMFWGPPFGFALGILIVDELRKLVVRTHPKVSHECVRAMMSSNRVRPVYHCQDGLVTYRAW